MTIREYLSADSEEMPAWLQAHQRGDSFNREAFFTGRTVYYPGSGSDGHPVKLFGGSHSAHAFIYTDYILDSAYLKRELEHPTHKFLGYHTFDRIVLKESDLAPRGWLPHIAPAFYAGDKSFVSPDFKPYAFVEILERDSSRDSVHGAARLAVLFLGADAFAAFDALYCQQDGTPPPYALFIQDHGFGCNYNRFGKGGLLEKIARSCAVQATRLVASSYSECWAGYQRVPEVRTDRGGMHNNNRFICTRRKDARE